MIGVASAVRQVILSNELAHTRRGLRQLVGWLTEIADDFAAHRANVDDLRWEIRRLERELRRRSGTLVTIALLILAGCGGAPHASMADRPRELAQCQVASTSGQQLSACLTMNKDWRADSALLAGARFQATIDSIERAIHAACARRAAHQADSISRNGYIDAGVNPNPQNAIERTQDSIYRAVMVRTLCG